MLSLKWRMSEYFTTAKGKETKRTFNQIFLT